MLQWFHPLVENPDDKNPSALLPVKNRVPVVVMPANRIRYLRAFAPHRRVGSQQAEYIFKVVRVSIGLPCTEVEQGVLVDRCEVLRREL